MAVATDYSKTELENLFAKDFSNPTFPQLAEIYLQDNVNSVTEIPSNGSEYQIVKHFTFTVL